MGKPLFYWPLAMLSSHPRINRIVVASLPDMMDKVEDCVSQIVSSGKISVIGGGATRQESVFNALKALSRMNSVNSADPVLVHDAARPFLTSAIIDETIHGVEQYGACTTAIPAADTIKRVKQNVVEETLDRSCLVVVQTPQAAKFQWLYSAHEQAAAQGLATTDDAALLEAAGHQVMVVPGSAYNLKVTHKEDLVLAEALAQMLFRQ